MKGRVKVTFSLPQEQQDYSTFVKEFLEETDRGVALASVALMDEWLNNILRAYFADGKSAKWLLKSDGPLSSFKSRTELAFALGLIDQEEYKKIELIRDIRNKFAHSWRLLKFDAAFIEPLCKKLIQFVPEAMLEKLTADYRGIFVFTVWSLLNQLVWRRLWAEKEKRSEEALSAVKKRIKESGTV